MGETAARARCFHDSRGRKEGRGGYSSGGLCELPMLLKRFPLMTRILIAAGVLSLGMALTNPVIALDTEPKAPPEADAALLDAMIGQMIMVGFAGSSERDSGVMAVRDQLAKGVIGGVVLYPENIGPPEQLRALTAFLRNAKSAPVPFIAVDQEGGLVQRLTRRNGHSYFPSARSVGRNPSYASADSVERLYATMAAELAEAGFNLNFGPVVDLNLNPANPVIGQRERSFGADPNTVTALARAFITRPSRSRHRHRGQTLPGSRLEPRRQPQGSRRRLTELAGDRA